MTLSSGEASDVKGYRPIMDEAGPIPKVLIGDKGYDRDAIRDDLTGRGEARRPSFPTAVTALCRRPWTASYTPFETG